MVFFGLAWDGWVPVSYDVMFCSSPVVQRFLSPLSQSGLLTHLGWMMKILDSSKLAKWLVLDVIPDGLQLNPAHQPPLRRRLLGLSKGGNAGFGDDFMRLNLEP